MMENNTRRSGNVDDDMVNLVTNTHTSEDRRDNNEHRVEFVKDCCDEPRRDRVATPLSHTVSSTTIRGFEIDQDDHDHIPVEKIGNYTDVIFAISLISLVFPLTTSTNNYDTSQDLRRILTKEIGNIIVYAVSFILLLSLWQQHCWVFAGFEQIGDTILILNVAFLLCVATLPYFVSFTASHWHTPLSVQLIAFSLMIIGIILGLIVACAYRKRKMLTREFRQRRFKSSLVEYLFTFGFHTVFSAMGVAVSRHSVYASYAATAMVIFSGFLSAFIMALYKYFFVGPEPHRRLWRHFTRRLSARPVPKSRLTGLTDGICAMVGVLLIINLISEMAPHHKLEATGATPPLDSRLKVILYQEREVLLAHGAAFVTTGMMWYMHTMISNHVETISAYTRVAMLLMLMCMGLTPYSFRLLLRYSKTEQEETHKYLRENEDTTIMFHCGILICASVLQLVYWISAYWSKHRHLIRNQLGRHHMKELTLLLVYPILNLTLLLLTLKPGAVTSTTVWRVQAASILIFLVIKIVFEMYTCVSRKIPIKKNELRQSARDERLVKLTPGEKRCTCDRMGLTSAKEKKAKKFTKKIGIGVIFKDNKSSIVQ